MDEKTLSQEAKVFDDLPDDIRRKLAIWSGEDVLTERQKAVLYRIYARGDFYAWKCPECNTDVYLVFADSKEHDLFPKALQDYDTEEMLKSDLKDIYDVTSISERIFGSEMIFKVDDIYLALLCEQCQAKALTQWVSLYDYPVIKRLDPTKH